MKTMIAFRRINTPNTPITNNTAEKNSASASIRASLPTLLAQHDGADDRGEEQNARHLERQQVLVEQRTGDRRNDARRVDLLRRISLGQCEVDRRFRLCQREDL